MPTDYLEHLYPLGGPQLLAESSSHPQSMKRYSEQPILREFTVLKHVMCTRCINLQANIPVVNKYSREDQVAVC